MTKIIVLGIPSERVAYIKLITVTGALILFIIISYGQKLFYDLLYVLAFVTPLATVDFVKTVRASKAGKYFLKNCKVIGNRLELSEEVEATWGFLEAIGHRTLSGLYSHDAFFISRSSCLKIRKVELENIGEDYFIALSKLGTGAAVIPGFKVVKGKCKGVIVVFLKPQSILYKPNEENIVLKYRQYVAEAEVKPQIGGIRGAVYVYKGEGKCYVELALTCMVEVEKQLFKVRITLAKPKDMIERFNYLSRINETYVIVTYGKNLSPIALAKKVGLRTPLITGVVNGDVMVELKMRIPLRKILTKRVKINLIKLQAFLPSRYF